MNQSEFYKCNRLSLEAVLFQALKTSGIMRFGCLESWSVHVQLLPAASLSGTEGAGLVGKLSRSRHSDRLGNFSEIHAASNPGRDKDTSPMDATRRKGAMGHHTNLRSCKAQASWEKYCSEPKLRL